MALPKSTASTLVKDLQQRGFLRRARDPRSERQLAITLTDVGARRVAEDTVLDLERLSAALETLPEVERRMLVAVFERLATASERLNVPG